MSEPQWVDIGSVEELSQRPVQRVVAERTYLAVCYLDGAFSVISSACNHFGGPLGEGRLDGEHVVCPWHGWRFHCKSGERSGSPEERVPAYDCKVEGGRLLVNLTARTERSRAPREPHPLARTPERAPGPPRVVGIATTAMDLENPRFSGSDHLLGVALEHARQSGCEASLIRLAELSFRACEGYYSKAARACTWPCTITQMSPEDQLDRVYEALVHWADVVLVATPIRWGAASSLYYRMAERMNCIQNQITIRDRVLIEDKVASFIIVGGQDNVQAVAGQMLGFFSELGFVFPPFPFVAHSRGWSAEDMERNVATVRDSTELADGTRALVDRAVAMSRRLLADGGAEEPLPRGGRKAHKLAVV